MTSSPNTPKRCRRCTANEAVVMMRTDHVCSDCYCRFISTKTVKRLEVLNRDTRGKMTQQQRQKGHAAGHWASQNNKTFLVGLSFGPSSAALVSICEQIIVGQLAKGRDAAFTLHVVHVDTDDAALPPVEPLLDRWRQRFPRFTFERVPLADALALAAIDWSLFPGSGPGPDTADRLRTLLDRLPSASSRRDVLDLLVRRLLIARATAADRYYALLLGCSTTALAERTLAETAKGRGFSLPWQIDDGPAAETPEAAGPASTLLYYPMRELFRKELVTYTSLVQPPLADLIFPAPASSSSTSSSAAAAVVSHKHLSIEEVMTRYFAEVEANYPSVVANVVKTAMKLERQSDVDAEGGEATQESGKSGSGSGSGCGTCGMPLDRFGNERWKGEIGELGSIDGGVSGHRPPGAQRLCYGCERSIHG